MFLLNNIKYNKFNRITVGQFGKVLLANVNANTIPPQALDWELVALKILWSSGNLYRVLECSMGSWNWWELVG